MTTEFPVDGVVDAHVHLMPDRLMRAIRDALGEAAGWTFDHPTGLDAMTEILRDAGVEEFFALPYAHRPGMADELNEWVCETAASSEQVLIRSPASEIAPRFAPARWRERNLPTGVGEPAGEILLAGRALDFPEFY